MPITINQNRNGHVVIRAIANESYIVAGNSSVSNLFTTDDATPAYSNVPVLNSTNTYIVGARIVKIWASGEPNTHWKIARSNGSANVVLFDVVPPTLLELDKLGFASNGVTELATGNLVITVAGGTSNGTLMLELKKDMQFNSEY
jgi:hypothetical protein